MITRRIIVCFFLAATLGCSAVTGDAGKSTGTTDGTENSSGTTGGSSDKGSGANAPISLPPVVTDPSFILTAHLDTTSKGTASLTGTVAKLDGTPVPGETVTAILTRSQSQTQSPLKALQIIPDTLEQVSGTITVTDGRGTFTITFETVQEADKIFVASEKSNALKLDTLPPTLESAIDLNSNALSATGVTEIRADSFFLIRFSESMLTSSVSDRSISIACDNAGNVPVTVTTSVDVVGIGFIEYRIAPTYSLPPLSNCTMTIAGGGSGVLDLSDNPMSESASFALKTGPTTVKAMNQWLQVGEDVASEAKMGRLTTTGSQPLAAVSRLAAGKTEISFFLWDQTVWTAQGDLTQTFDAGTTLTGVTVLEGVFYAGFCANTFAAYKITSGGWQEAGSMGADVSKPDCGRLATDGTSLYAVTRVSLAGGQKEIDLNRWDGSGWDNVGKPLTLAAGHLPSRISLAFIGTTPYLAYVDQDAQQFGRFAIKRFVGGAWEAINPQPEALRGSVLDLFIAQGSSMIYLVWSETTVQGSFGIYMQHFDGGSWVQDGDTVSDPLFDAKEPSLVFIQGVPYIGYAAGDTLLGTQSTRYDIVVKRGQ